MKIVVSTFERPGRTDLLGHNPDLIEIRLDLVKEDLEETVREWHKATGIPLILTIRSESEGGAFPGTTDTWFEMIIPLLSYASYIDIEQQFSSRAGYIREKGIKIVASCHMQSMPSIQELSVIDDTLREYGDIPKIVVTPSDKQDILMFLSFTLHAGKPVVTSFMGGKYNYMRPLLPLFGSEWIFGHAGEATAAGQYHISDIQAIYARLLQGDDV
jgi:3-dehydroquinate dehydratase I